MMSPIGPAQGMLATSLDSIFSLSNLPPESLQCRIQLPIVARDHSEPEPDLAIVRRRDDDYRQRTSVAGRCLADHRSRTVFAQV